MSELDRRAMLEAAMDSHEEAVETPEEVEIEEPVETEEVHSESAAEESVEAKTGVEDREEPAQDVEAAQSEEQDEEEKEEPAKPAIARPTTWKKEYLPIWDKLTTGQQLTPEESLKLAEYSNQRESEYKKGVSTYKQEADNAKSLVEAITPFMPEIQAQNMHPAAWINSLGRAHMILSKAPYEQKVALFQRLAQDYGLQSQDIPVAQTQQYQDPQSYALSQQLQTLQNEVQQVRSWREQEEANRLNVEIQKFSSNVEQYPHFEVVREDMAQLLERGLAPDLKTAYEKAVRMNDDVFKLEQERLLNQAKKEASKAQQVAKAKSVAVSPKSVTPSGVVAKTDAKDRRSLIAAQMGEVGGRV